MSRLNSLRRIVARLVALLSSPAAAARRLIPGFVAFAVAAPFLSAAGPWQWVSPSPTGNHLNSFAYGAGQFVGVGTSGEIVTSPDGATWTPRESGVSAPLTRVVHDGTRFVAIAASNILVSSDGAVWTKHPAPAGLRDLVFGNDRFVATSYSSPTDTVRLLVSPDALTWTDTTVSAQALRVLHANGIFVAIDNAGRTFSSADGLAWTTAQLPAAMGTSFFFAAGNDRFLLSSSTGTYVSTDGSTWREVTAHPVDPGTSQTLTVPKLEGGVAGSAMGFAGGYFYIQQSRYAADAYRYYRSADGETWEPVTTMFANADLTTLAAGGGVWVGVERGTLYTGPNRRSFAIYSSPNGLSWTARSRTPINSYANLVYALGRFFAGDMVSSDAVTWVTNPFEPTHAAGDLVFRITSKFHSDDRPSTVIHPGATTSVEASADGLTSARVDVKITTPRSIAFGAGRYVAVGEGGMVSHSADGFTWTAGTSGATANLRAVLFAFDRFVAVGSGGTLLTSPDGLVWSAHTTGTTIDFVSVAAGPDRIVVGTLGSGSAVPALTLAGGVTIQIATTRRSDALAWFDGEFTSFEHNLMNWPSATGSVSLARSGDGVTWTEEITRLPWGPKGPGLLAVSSQVALLLAPAGLGWSSEPLFSALLEKRAAGTAAPVITHPPLATTVHQGETARFSVGATGSGAFTYQWNRDGTPIAGATSQIFSLPLAKDADAGEYTVTVTNAQGSATSAPARLTVQTAQPLMITQQPVGGTLYEFQTFRLAVEVTGSGPITYQWRRNGTPIGGATASSYEIWAASYSMDNYTGTYDVVVTAPFGTVTSHTAIVSRSGPVVTVSQAGDTGLGGVFVVTATAVGKAPFTYAWSRAGGQALAGATGDTLVLPNVISTDSSSYSVTVTDADGHPGQAFFVLTGPAANPAPAQSHAAAAAGQKLTLRAPISAADAGNSAFQWRFNNVPLAGATHWSFTTPAVTDTTVGDYSVLVTATGGNTARYTTTVTLAGTTPTPAPAPVFVAQTSARTVAPGGATTFAVSVGAGSVSSYQWQVSTNGGASWTNLTDGGAYAGTTTSVLAITGATAAMNDHQYRAIASNGTTTITSTAATLTINTNPPLAYPVALARDAAGNLFVADASANVIRKISPAGGVSVFAGTAGNAGSADGTGAAARFNQPGGLAFDPAGNLLVADTGNALIRKLSPAGAVTTLAGDAALRGNVDGAGGAARFNHPTGIAIDSAGNAYVSDTFTHTIRKVTPTGMVSTLAGTPGVSGAADGTGAAARFNHPAGIAVDAAGTIYVADTHSHTIRKITAEGGVTTLAGLAGVSGADDGTGSAAFFSQPTSLAVDANGTVYVADTGNALIRRVLANGIVTLVAGVPGVAGFTDGVGLDALFDQPRGVVLDGNGVLTVVDTGNAALRRIAANAAVTTLALTSAPVTPPSSVPETPATPPSPGGSPSTGTGGGGGGGGAPSHWFAGALALLWCLRRLRR
ncbi:MAG TPA: immunoglobulin domain-containing protein [Lacunisphaera sp.]|nr:immunoglobulin domain-containing protein [Lacunisphaera sp.]